MGLSRELVCDSLPLSALDAAPSAALVTDLDGKILWVNDAFTRLTGYTTADAIGNTPRLLRSGRHDSRFYGQLWSEIRSGRVWTGKMTNRRKDGSVYEEEQSIIPVRDPDGAVSRFLAIKRDVTAREQVVSNMLNEQDT